MSSTYGYVSRDLSKSTVDWGKISETVSQNIAKNKVDEQKKQQLLDQGYIDSVNKLNEQEKSLNPTLSGKLRGLGNEDKQYLKTAYDKMTNNEITITQYKNIEAQVLEDWKSMGGVLGDFNTMISDLGTSSNPIDQYKANKIMKTADNFKIHRAGNGRGYLVEIDDNGKVVPNSEIAISAMSTGQYAKTRQFDVTEEVSDIVKGAGTYVTTKDISGRTIAVIEDFKQSPQYKQFLDTSLSSLMSDEEGLASFLTDQLQLTPTEDPQDVANDPDKYILLETNPNGGLTPKLSDDQKNTIKDILKNQIESGIKQSYKLQRDPATVGVTPSKPPKAVKLTVSSSQQAGLSDALAGRGTSSAGLPITLDAAQQEQAVTDNITNILLSKGYPFQVSIGPGGQILVEGQPTGATISDNPSAVMSGVTTIVNSLAP